MYFGAVLQTAVQESETVRTCSFFIALFMLGSPQNDHLLAACVFWYVRIKEHAAPSQWFQEGHRLPDTRVGTHS